MFRDHLQPLWSEDAGEAAVSAPERHEIADRYKWRLDRIFPDWKTWDAQFAAVDAALPGLEQLRGTLGDSADNLLTALEAVHDVQRKLSVVSVYASMRSDEDTRDSENTARRGRAGSLATRFAEAVSWFEPELLGLDDTVVDGFLAESEALRLYTHHLDDLRRFRPHTLDADREALLAAAGNVTRGASRIFSALVDADLRFPAITDEQGRDVELTHGRFSKYLKSRDREVRRQTYEAYLDTYGNVANTLAATMDANVKNHVFRAEARRYDGCLHASMHPDAVPV